MPRREDRRSYIVVRPDGLAVHTKPITVREAGWLFWDAYNSVEDRSLRARYLGEWGNVLDVGDYLERLAQLMPPKPNFKPYFYVLYFNVLGVYEGPRSYAEKVNWLLGLRLPPGARRAVGQALEELLGKIEEFAREPVEPRPIVAPVRYIELPYWHGTLDPGGWVKDVEPQPEWHAYEEPCSEACRGASVFPDSLWLWLQPRWYVQAVAVRRDAPDGEVVAALANDNLVQAFLGQHGNAFRELLREHEKELTDRGYDDVIRKAKLALAAVELLGAGRREEEGVPA